MIGHDWFLELSWPLTLLEYPYQKHNSPTSPRKQSLHAGHFGECLYHGRCYKHTGAKQRKDNWWIFSCWWFQIFFYVHPYLGKWSPFWWAYFSDGLVKHHQPVGEYVFYGVWCVPRTEVGCNRDPKSCAFFMGLDVLKDIFPMVYWSFEARHNEISEP